MKGEFRRRQRRERWDVSLRLHAKRTPRHCLGAKHVADVTAFALERHAEVALGLVFAVLAAASDSVWAVLAGRARLWFARRPRRLDTMSTAGGVMMVGLGVSLAATD